MKTSEVEHASVGIRAGYQSGSFGLRDAVHDLMNLLAPLVQEAKNTGDYEDAHSAIFDTSVRSVATSLGVTWPEFDGEQEDQVEDFFKHLSACAVALGRNPSKTTVHDLGTYVVIDDTAQPPQMLSSHHGFLWSAPDLADLRDRKDVKVFEVTGPLVFVDLL